MTRILLALSVLGLGALGCVRPGPYGPYGPYGYYRPYGSYGYHSARSAIRKDYERSIRTLRRSPYRPSGQRSLRRP
jgi:hypothetical protein